jgi:hypothetical protein
VTPLTRLIGVGLLVLDPVASVIVPVIPLEERTSEPETASGVESNVKVALLTEMLQSVELV